MKMKININCQYYSFGKCNHLDMRFFKFRKSCPLIQDRVRPCIFKEEYPRPSIKNIKPPPKKRIIGH